MLYSKRLPSGNNIFGSWIRVWNIYCTSERALTKWRRIGVVDRPKPIAAIPPDPAPPFPAVVPACGVTDGN